MSVKSQFFKLNKEDFDSYLKGLKECNNCIHLLGGKFFFVQSLDVTNKLIELNKKTIQLDCLIASFTEFARKQIVQSFIIDEIQSTNKIEGIFSTKHDILKIINDAGISKDKKVVFVAKAYKYLLENGGSHIETCLDIRNLYDAVLKSSVGKDDLPDGIYFRKGPVYITNGIEPIHKGIYGEDNIRKLMEEFIDFYNSKNELYIRMILCHFMFEYIHPYYDGNGRLGRFLFSNEVHLETGSYFSFAIAASFLHEKSKYYKAFKEGNDKYEFGSLNTYADTMLTILLEQVDSLNKKLSLNKQQLDKAKPNLKLIPSEQSVFKLLNEASLFSYFGVSNEEIMKETQVSKRTLMYILDKFKKEGLLITTKIGRFNYHKLKK